MLDDVLNKITNATNRFNPQLHQENAELGRVVRLLCDRVTASLEDVKQDPCTEE